MVPLSSQIAVIFRTEDSLVVRPHGRIMNMATANLKTANGQRVC
jgi:hypothetical protein